MDSKVELYLHRAQSELYTGKLLLELSGNKKLQDFNISEDETFYSGVISHCYYAIFYAAKAMLLTKGLDTKAPEVHKKTLDAFKENFIDSGTFDMKLLLIYKKLIVKAENLLHIFKYEKKKRGNFTYNTIAQANELPAKESFDNAKTFFKHCNTYLRET
ncbi:MAG: HEPN domain-containing protein [Candidatus Woesearchaeota archaeon]